MVADRVRCHGWDAARGDSGVALLAVLGLVVLLGAVGTAVVLVADTDAVIASANRDATINRHAAEAIAAFVVSELSLATDWTSVLQGSVRSGLTGALVLPANRGAVDLTGLTTRLQQDTYGSMDWGSNTPQWRPYAWGAPGTDLAISGFPRQVYTIGWVADDVADEDGDPTNDSNRRLLVRVRAMGPGAAQVDVQTAIALGASGLTRATSWRVLR